MTKKDLIEVLIWIFKQCAFKAKVAEFLTFEDMFVHLFHVSRMVAQGRLSVL